MRELALAGLGVILMGFGVLLFICTVMPAPPGPVTSFFRSLPGGVLGQLAISAGAILLGNQCLKPLVKAAG